MSESVLLWITGQDDREDSRLAPLLRATENAVDVQILGENDLSDFLHTGAADRVIGAVIAPSIQNPVAAARLFLRRLPGHEVIFISGEDEEPSAKRNMNVAFLYGHHRTIHASDPEEGVQTIRRLLGQARRQRRSRWALARMNEQIAQARDETVHQKRLAISDRLLISIFAQSPDALFALDLDGFVLAANRAAVSNFNLGESEGTHFTETALSEELPDLKELVAAAAKTQETRRQELVLTRPGPDGPESLFLETSASPVFNESSSIIGVTVLLRDVSELKRAEKRLKGMNEALESRVNERTRELRELNERMEGFLYSAAHDLRAPIRSIAGFTQILEEEHMAELDEEAQDLMRRVTRAALRMDRLVQDLLAYSRVAKIELPLNPVELEEVLENARSTLSDQIAQSGAELEIDAPPGTVLAHETTFEQAVINLLSNALQYPRPDEPLRVRVTARWSNDRCRLTIEDNGIGIDPAYHEKIFAIFERVAPSTAKSSGTGIGLAIVKGGVERMGGIVGVESELGKGSSFWIEIPAARGPSE